MKDSWELRFAKKFVSVLIDTYNHERFIEQAIVSVLEQDFPQSEREIIVVDNGSTDLTAGIVKKFEPRVRLLRKENGGQASAFNAGIPESKGEIVAFLDGDDWWAPNKLKAVAGALAGDSSIGIVGHGIVNVERDGRERAETLREGFRFQANTIEGAFVSPPRCFSRDQSNDNPRRPAWANRADSRSNSNSSGRVLVHACRCVGGGADSAGSAHLLPHVRSKQFSAGEP
ncbi:MAG TPA: glycosyltransferase family A protein [Candidatus Acidoferrum sp.]|nr:glycosyltransferase family A protein [Candidatus Acidoferrum sp.]